MNEVKKRNINKSNNRSSKNNNNNSNSNNNNNNSNNNSSNNQTQRQQHQSNNGPSSSTTSTTTTTTTTINWAKDFMNWNDGYLERERIQVQQKDRCFKVLKKSTVACIILLFISCTLVYAMTQNPSVTGGDAGELIIVAHQMGVGHPPGYPLFTVLGYIFSHLFPSNSFSVAWKVSLMSSIIGSIASIFIYLTVYLWVNNHWCGLLSAYMFTFSPLIWMYQIQGEVFSLNNMFVAMLLFLGVWYTRVRIFENERYNTAFWTSERIAYLCAFSCALGLTNQHTLVLVVVPFAFWLMFIAGRDQLWNIKSITNLIFYTAIGLSPYLILFLLPKLNRVKYSWGNTSTLRGFMKHFLREEYGTLQLYGGEEETSISLLTKLYTYLQDSILQFNYIGLALIFIGLLNFILGYNLRTFKWKSFGTMIIFSFLFYVTFFFNLCNLPIEKPLYKGVFLRFFMQPNVFLSVAMGLGLKTAFQKVNEKFSKYLLPIVAIVLSVYQVQSNYSIQDQSNNYSFYDYGRAILDPLPRNAILLASGDLCTNVPMYLNLVEKVRPDVDILSMELMSWDWFGVTQSPLFNRVIFPGYVYHPYIEGAYSLKTFLDANIRNRPIYLAGDFKSGDYSFQKDYIAINKGLTSQIIPVKDASNYNVYKIIANTQKTFPSFKLPNDTIKYPQDSWEYFMIGEVVLSLERAAENLYKNYLSQETPESDKALELTLEILLRSLELKKDGCWALKHIGISYDHLRYRVLKDNSNSQRTKQAEYYSTQLLEYWRKYINLCSKEKDNDWDTINRVVNSV